MVMIGHGSLPLIPEKILITRDKEIHFAKYRELQDRQIDGSREGSVLGGFAGMATVRQEIRNGDGQRKWLIGKGRAFAALPDQLQSRYAFHRSIGGEQLHTGGKGSRRNQAIGGILLGEIRALRKCGDL